MPPVVLPVTVLWSISLASAARTSMPVPFGTMQTSSPGWRQVFALLLSWLLLWSMRLS